ncbi:MAG: phosphate ABC transporter substrate-binding protein PstS [Acidobacteriia bacterium]|nr:phosphate ABC transporter substrate-binding protein PstS [Terriglobia bacterium]
MTRRIFIVNAALAAALTVGTASAQQVLINAAGATFPYPMYSKWFDEYHKKFPTVQINYQSIGSGGGIQQVTAGTVDFGASDGPMNDMQLKDFQDKRGSAILHFPTVMGAVVPTYNIPGVTGSLNFTPEALAGIFLGKITKWDDPELTKANPGIKLPSNNIVVVHRSDGSGTTYVWVDYLSKISKEWETKVGKATSVNWPVGLGGKGNEGVSGSIQQTANSVGYVELIYAVQNKMTYGNVKNASGEFIQASLASVTAAAAAMKDMPEDFRVSITNAPGKGVYPISSFTWLLIPSKIADPAKKKAIKDFLTWMLADGQKMTEALSYAQLPKPVIAKEVKAIAKIQ